MAQPRTKGEIARRREQQHPAVNVAEDMQGMKNHQPSKGMVMRNLHKNQQKRAANIFAKYNFSPLETLVAAATDPEADTSLTQSIAMMLLPYEVPKLKSVDLNVNPTAGAPRIAIKQFFINGPGAPVAGPMIDVTAAHAEGRLEETGAAQPLVDAVNRAAEKMVEDGLVEAVVGREDDEDE